MGWKHPTQTQLGGPAQWGVGLPPASGAADVCTGASLSNANPLTICQRRQYRRSRSPDGRGFSPPAV